MTPTEYDYFAEFLLKSSGLNLGTGKEYLLESRLLPVAQSLGLQQISELIPRLRNQPTAELKNAVVEAMTTNETLFFRDKKPFDDLTELMLPAILEARPHARKLRIWCAACSSGQEPYSIMMALRESFPHLRPGESFEIVATDLSEQILARARTGVYSQFEVQRGLPIQLLMKYFTKTEAGWQIQPELRQGIHFRPLNLLEPFVHLGRFDIIFCRNVLIYFETETKRHILDRMAPLVEKHGYLVLGGAETVLGICDSFRRATGFRAAIYNPAHSGVGLAGTAALAINS